MKSFFGKTTKGADTYLYTLENSNIKASVTDYGATLVSLIDKKTGIDVVLGFDSTEGYSSQDAYIGASIGRVANRIGRGRFILNGTEYRVPVNNNGNSLHGGLEGFDKKVWQAEEKEDSVIFRYTSADGEEGYPGNLDVTVKYVLREDGIAIEVSGTPDQDTLFAFTNHSYFNVDGSDSVLNQELKIESTQFSLNDSDGMATGVIRDTEDTPFDFREFHTIGERINDDDIQLKEALGYDHYCPIPGTGMRKMAELKGKKVSVSLWSDLPGMQFYSANYTDGLTGKYGRKYTPRCAMALEAEFCPNAVNYENIAEKPIVKAGETLTCEIRFLLKTL